MLTNNKAFSGFAVPDVDRAREFYGDTLGLETSVENDTLVYPKPDHEPATYTILNFVVDDIEQAVDQLAERGVTFERYDMAEQDERGINRGEGPPIAWFKDPAGNILSVIQLN